MKTPEQIQKKELEQLFFNTHCAQCRAVLTPEEIEYYKSKNFLPACKIHIEHLLKLLPKAMEMFKKAGF